MLQNQNVKREETGIYIGFTRKMVNESCRDSSMQYEIYISMIYPGQTLCFWLYLSIISDKDTNLR